VKRRAEGTPSVTPAHNNISINQMINSLYSRPVFDIIKTTHADGGTCDSDAEHVVLPANY
jgi:hypothetical protein